MSSAETMTDLPRRGELSGAPELAAHARWIRALARSLVADPGRADDLVQDTWVAALRSGPRDDRPLRGWLATVLRRRFFEHNREDAGRREREQRAARGEALPSTLEMLEKAAVQRDVVQAVLELGEPYRTAILWRYFEDLPPREIARRARVPVATVHSRIARGLAQLRVRLDGRHGNDGRGWLLALAPILGTKGPGWIPAGAALVKTSTQIAIASAAAAALVAVFALRSRPEAEPGLRTSTSPGSDPVATTPHAPPPGDSIDRTVPDGTNARVAAHPPGESRPPEPETTTEPPVRVLRGEVLDPNGARLSGVALLLREEGGRPREEPSPSASGGPLRSGTDGRFEVPVQAGDYAVYSADPRWATVLAGSARVAPETLAIVVVAARLDLAGTVVDGAGTPLQGAELTLQVPRAFGADLGRALDASVERRWRSVSDADGAFTIADVPSIPGAALSVALGGFEPRSEPLPPVSDSAMRIVLERPRPSGGRLAGIVVDPSGGFVPGARVSVGWESTFSDDAGRFELDLAKSPAPTRAIATKDGFLPAILEAELAADEAPSWPAGIVLHLGGSPRRIAGRVLDGEGSPVPAARVWLEDPTYFGLVEEQPVQVETLLGCKDAVLWGFVRTQADGTFEIAGCLERSYKLRALDPRTLLSATSEPVESGSRGVEIRLPKDALRERVAGRVVTRDGQPVAGASVVVQRFGFSAPHPGGGTHDEWVPRPEVQSDAKGRFEIRDVPKDGVELFVHGETILFWSMDLKPETDTEDLRVVVNRRMHLQVELDPPVDRADELRVLDGDGTPLILRIMRGESSFTNRRADVTDGRSQVLSTSEDARTLVLYKAGVEVGRIPLALRPDFDNLVRDQSLPASTAAAYGVLFSRTPSA